MRSKMHNAQPNTPRREADRGTSLVKLTVTLEILSITCAILVPLVGRWYQATKPAGCHIEARVLARADMAPTLASDTGAGVTLPSRLNAGRTIAAHRLSVVPAKSTSDGRSHVRSGDPAEGGASSLAALPTR